MSCPRMYGTWIVCKQELAFLLMSLYAHGQRADGALRLLGPRYHHIPIVMCLLCACHVLIMCSSCAFHLLIVFHEITEWVVGCA